MHQILQGKRIWILVGTRPEVIKQAPLYLELANRLGQDQVALVGTGQHRELLEQALTHFGLKLDVTLEIMKPNQTLTGSAAAVLSGMERLFAFQRPDWLVVQGDTTSAAMAAWAAFVHKIRVAHNEAGLRSYDLLNPYPEEANRRLISVVADLHLAPTERARDALLAEKAPADRVFVTGNTGIDALRLTLAAPAPETASALCARILAGGRRPVLLTAHRRENSGEGMMQWFEALARFLRARPDIALIYPVHPNNLARPAIEAMLAPLPQVHLLPAIHYGETCHILKHSRFVVTDSGGIQEEASSLGIPVVVCRKTTERMEAVHAGIARLAGLEVESIVEAMDWAYSRSASASATPPVGIVRPIFGDGFASARIADLLRAPAARRSVLASTSPSSTQTQEAESRAPCPL